MAPAVVTPARCAAAPQTCEDVGYDHVSTVCRKSGGGGGPVCHVPQTVRTLPFQFGATRSPSWAVQVGTGTEEGVCTLHFETRSADRPEYRNLPVPPVVVSVKVPARFSVPTALPEGYVGHMRCSDSKHSGSCSGAQCDVNGGYGGSVAYADGAADGDDFRLSGCAPQYRLLPAAENPPAYTGTMACTDRTDASTCGGLACKPGYVGAPRIVAGAAPGAAFQVSGCEGTYVEYSASDLPAGYQGTMRCTDGRDATSCSGLSCANNYVGQTAGCVGQGCVAYAPGPASGGHFAVSGCVPSYATPSVPAGYSGTLSCASNTDASTCSGLSCAGSHRGVPQYANPGGAGDPFVISGCVPAKALDEACASSPVDTCGNYLKCSGGTCKIAAGNGCGGANTQKCSAGLTCDAGICRVPVDGDCSSGLNSRCALNSVCGNGASQRCMAVSSADSTITVSAELRMSGTLSSLSVPRRNSLLEWAKANAAARFMDYDTTATPAPYTGTRSSASVPRPKPLCTGAGSYCASCDNTTCDGTSCAFNGCSNGASRCPTAVDKLYCDAGEPEVDAKNLAQDGTGFFKMDLTIVVTVPKGEGSPSTVTSAADISAALAAATAHGVPNVGVPTLVDASVSVSDEVHSKVTTGQSVNGTAGASMSVQIPGEGLTTACRIRIVDSGSSCTANPTKSASASNLDSKVPTISANGELATFADVSVSSANTYKVCVSEASGISKDFTFGGANGIALTVSQSTR
jgi:hypothetical protein